MTTQQVTVLSGPGLIIKGGEGASEVIARRDHWNSWSAMPVQSHGSVLLAAWKKWKKDTRQVCRGAFGADHKIAGPVVGFVRAAEGSSTLGVETPSA